MMIYIADTHSLIWFLSDDKKLSSKAKEDFEKTETGESIIIIPTIVLAELLYICEKKGFGDLFSEILNKLKIGSNYISYNLDLDILIECKKFLNIPEMHDKIIAATATLLNCDVITKDEEIKNSAYVKTVW